MESHFPGHGGPLLFLAPPYDFEWVEFTGGGSASADKRNGEFTVFAITAPLGYQSRAVGAGLGIRYQPLSSLAMVRFSALLRYDYSWYLISSGFPAHTEASYFITLCSWDLTGGDFRREREENFPLWRDGTGGFETDGAADDDVSMSLSTNLAFRSGILPFPLTNQRVYLVWLWASVWGDGHPANAYIESFARASLATTVPFVVFEAQ